jgi:hypothetical protein
MLCSTATMCGGDFALSLTERFIESSYVKWHTATSHLFLTACKDGSIARSQFDKWLCQVSRVPSSNSEATEVRARVGIATHSTPICRNTCTSKASSG